MVTAQGYAKRVVPRNLRLANRGDIGIQSIQFSGKTDALAGIVPAQPETFVTVLTNTERIARVAIDTISRGDLRQGGDRILRLQKKEKIVEILVAYTPDPAETSGGEE